MTLDSRNKLILSQFVVAVLFIIVTAVVFVLAILNNSLVFPESSQRLFSLPARPLLAPNMFAALLSAIILVLYSAVMLGISLVNFEKTRSLEIIYFVCFSLGCLFEGIRIWLPVFNFWEDNSALYVFVGHGLFFGRALAIVNLLALSLLSLELENNQNIEMNLLVVVTLAALLARLIPIESLVVPSSCSIRFGYEKMFLSMSVITLLVGFLSMICQSENQGSGEYTPVAIGFLLLSFGYLSLTQADCFFVFGLGTILLTIGSIIFLVNLHRFHVWK